MASILECVESPKYMSTDERIAFKITTTNVISSPTSPSAKAYDESVGEDVTSTVYPSNSATVSGDVITLDLLRALTLNHSYRIEVKWTVGSNIYECFFIVKCIR